MRHYLLVNIVLIALAGFLGVKLYLSVSEPLDILPETVEGKNAATENDQGAENIQGTNAASSDFQIIAEKDLFRPERSVPRIAIALDIAPPQSLPPVLVGTVITESGAQAYLKSSTSNAVKAYRVDDTIEGFTIHEIQRDRVILLKEGEKVEVKLEGGGNIKEVNSAPSSPQIPSAIPQRVPARTPPRPLSQKPQQPAEEILPLEEVRDNEYQRNH